MFNVRMNKIRRYETFFSVIQTLIYLVNCTCHDISISVNLIARYSSSLTQKHWNRVIQCTRVCFILKYPN